MTGCATSAATLVRAARPWQHAESADGGRRPPDRGEAMLDQQIQVQGWRGGDGDAAYLDKTLRHQAMELSLDESVAGVILRRFWARAAAVAGVWFLLFLVVWLLSGGAGSTSSSYNGGGSGGDDSMLIIATVGSFVIFWLVFLLSRLQEPIGEWRVLLADRAAVKPHVYSFIHRRLRDRDMPVSFTARRIRPR